MNGIPMTEERLLARSSSVVPDFERLVGGSGDKVGRSGGKGERGDAVLRGGRSSSLALVICTEGGRENAPRAVPSFEA